MLHAGARKTLDLAEVYTFVLQALQNQVDSFEPHGCGCVDLTLAGVCEDTLGDAILGSKVSIKVDLGLVPVLEVGVHDDTLEVLVRF